MSPKIAPYVIKKLLEQMCKRKLAQSSPQIAGFVGHFVEKYLPIPAMLRRQKY